MIAFNRLTAFMLAALLLISGLLVIALVLYLPGPYTFTAFDGQQFTFSPLSTFDRLATAGGGLLLLLAGIFLLALELLGPPTRQQLPLQTSEDSHAAISRQSVEQRLTDVLERLPGVVQASPHIQFQRSGTAVDAHLTTDPEVAVPPLCEQAHALLAATLEHDLGLQPGVLRVYVRHAQPQAGKDSAAAAV
ncbi:MAG TPA: hypothetical protein VIU62_04560 [Chloroflexota bacterium]|jgi:hypothetical protein